MLQVRCFWNSIVLAILVVTAAPGRIYSQAAIITNPMLSDEFEIELSSGKIFHDKQKATVWQDEVTMKGAKWLRLDFEHLVLAGDPTGGESSILRITSLADGKFQILNSESAAQWRNKSAYFNGDSVRLELFAAGNNRLNLITLRSVTVGLPDGNNGISSTICDDIDDRELSDDPRAGRTAPGGCTAWLFNDRSNCFLTAGHCQASTEVMLFNVPLSDANGNREFPGPEDQYPVDFSSFQGANGGVGNDWCYFGCFENSNTGLTPFEAQGASYQLADAMPVQEGDQIRITGYGSTSFPVDESWNGAQKTQLGFYSFFSNDDLRYRTDTTGGNSGSAIVLESTGEAIGIHTHGGCGSGGSGANIGTASIQSELTQALQNPRGICMETVGFDFPDARPEIIDPSGATSITVAIDDSEIEVDRQSAFLQVDAGEGIIAVPLTYVESLNQYVGQFPASTCGSVVDYFFTIESTTGTLFTDPPNAPSSNYNAVSANSVARIELEDNFESDFGWSVTGDVTTGDWQRGVPIGGGNRNDPPTDADGSGSCYVTENIDGNFDVDNGSTTLTSPTLDVSVDNNQTAVLSYFRWFNNGGSELPMVIEISNDDGVKWNTLESFSDATNSSGGWVFKAFDVSDFVELTDQIRIRFTVSDEFNNAVVEAGIDAFSVKVFDCEELLLGDVNQDGLVNLLDVGPFVLLLENEGFQSEADINMDGVVDLLDVGPLVQLLSNAGSN